MAGPRDAPGVSEEPGPSCWRVSRAEKGIPGKDSRHLNSSSLRVHEAVSWTVGRPHGGPSLACGAQEGARVLSGGGVSGL